jgi:hypothetical protein
VPNSAAIESKNAPKLYTTPNTVNVLMKVAATTPHPRAESTRETRAVTFPIGRHVYPTVGASRATRPAVQTRG